MHIYQMPSGKRKLAGAKYNNELKNANSNAKSKMPKYEDVSGHHTAHTQTAAAFQRLPYS